SRKGSSVIVPHVNVDGDSEEIELSAVVQIVHGDVVRVENVTIEAVAISHFPVATTAVETLQLFQVLVQFLEQLLAETTLMVLDDFGEQRGDVDWI
ncbi:hypothetical protein PENTCL1PPCAC_19571, partial [Pristionchus entomophagus]